MNSLKSHREPGTRTELTNNYSRIVTKTASNLKFLHKRETAARKEEKNQFSLLLNSIHYVVSVFLFHLIWIDSTCMPHTSAKMNVWFCHAEDRQPAFHSVKQKRCDCCLHQPTSAHLVRALTHCPFLARFHPNDEYFVLYECEWSKETV